MRRRPTRPTRTASEQTAAGRVREAGAWPPRAAPRHSHTFTVRWRRYALRVRDAAGLARTTLVGHSLGSFAARRVASTRPDRITRLVLIGSAVPPANEAVLELREAVGALPDPVPPDFVRAFLAGPVPLPEPFFEGLVAASLKVPAHVWRSALDGVLATDDAADLGRIAAPTLLLSGERHAYFGRTEQERLAAAIPGARLTLYPETGTSSHWERPERVAGDLHAVVRAT